MNILLASDTYYPNVNGASYFTQRLASLLAAKGHNVSVIAPSERFSDTVTLRDGVTVYGLRSITTPFYKNFRISPLIWSQATIQKIVHDVHPDVIHLQNHFIIGKGVLAAARELGIPVMGTNHFMPENLVHVFHMPRFIEERLKLLGWNQFLHVFKDLDVVASPTRTAAQLIQRYGLQKEVTPVSCGIDLTRFNTQNDATRLKKQYGVPMDRKVILSVGRLEKEKRVEVTLRALPEIVAKTDAHFIIAGIGKLQSALQQLAKSLGVSDHVTFTGFVPDEDMPDLYKTADVFVTAGIAELQSIVTMEAMASGLPVVAVNAVALPELVHDAENGFLFDAEDSTALARGVVTLLSDEALYSRMSKASLAIIQKHDIHNTIAAYEELYKKTIDLHAQRSKVTAA